MMKSCAYHLLSWSSQDIYEKAYHLDKKKKEIPNFLIEKIKNMENGPLAQKQQDKPKTATGLGRITREEIGRKN